MIHLICETHHIRATSESIRKHLKCLAAEKSWRRQLIPQAHSAEIGC